MAMSVVYTTFGGMLVHENRGGTERQYISDPLGSLVGELDSTQAVTYTAEYWPYGEIQTETGTNTSPWSFVGLLGYLKDLTSLLYVRARHYLTQKARWLTTDPTWPDESAFTYVSSIPTYYTDPSGLEKVLVNPGNEEIARLINELIRQLRLLGISGAALALILESLLLMAGAALLGALGFAGK